MIYQQDYAEINNKSVIHRTDLTLINTQPRK